MAQTFQYGNLSGYILYNIYKSLNEVKVNVTTLVILITSSSNNSFRSFLYGS